MNRRSQRFLVALVTVVIALAIPIAFEVARPKALSYDGLWNARTALWAGVLLLANLVVVSWYALLTREIVEISQHQHALAIQEAKDAAAERWQANKPIVVIVREEQTDGMFSYYLHNVGRGTA